MFQGEDAQGVFLEWTAGMMVDVDGSGLSHGDPCYQPDTTLHLNGAPLNADLDRYIVVPPQIRNAVMPIVMGCQAQVINTDNGLHTDAVVGDVGPHKKIGEASRAVALALSINPSPVSGGEERHVIRYRIRPGIAAVVLGKAYDLQPA